MLKGQIVFWYGSIETIPDGWALCDGDNGTPDLNRKFVRGAGIGLVPGFTGGTTKHSHSFTGDGHTHGIDKPGALAGGDPAFDYEILSESATGTTDQTNHNPEHHALCFIMKLHDDPDLQATLPWPYAAKAIVQFIMVGPNLEIYLTFRHKMNIDNKPANGLWLCELDEVPDAVDTSTWIDPWTMKLDIDAPGAPPDNVTVEYDGPSPLLATVWDKQWEPWGPIHGSDLA